MKVTTTACIQGAWTPDIYPKRILDIGAGTGLLSLMCAQRYQVHIDAVEIEDGAFGQLQENSAQSPWPQLIRPIHADIREFARTTKETYDFIITNPPFFRNQLKSPSARVNLAKHDASLTIEALAQLIPSLLEHNGLSSILLPPTEVAQFRVMSAEAGLYLQKELLISEYAGGPVASVVSLLGKKPEESSSRRLTIRTEAGEYTEEFAGLLRPFYLNL